MLLGVLDTIFLYQIVFYMVCMVSMRNIDKINQKRKGMFLLKIDVTSESKIKQSTIYLRAVKIEISAVANLRNNKKENYYSTGSELETSAVLMRYRRCSLILSGYVSVVMYPLTLRGLSLFLKFFSV